MSPEKVAVLLVTALIAILLSVALVGSEAAEAGQKPTAGAVPGKTAPPAPIREPVDPVARVTAEDIRRGRARQQPASRPTDDPANPAQPETVQYKVKPGDSLERIARRELGNAAYVWKITALNPNVDPKKLHKDDVLILPVVKKAAATADGVVADAPKTTPKGRKTPRTQ